MLAHNGEINTLKGNVNWMKAHETRMEHPAFGAHMQDLKPIIGVGLSNSGAFDSVFEVMVRAGRTAPMVKMMLVPQALTSSKTTPDHHKALIAYCNSVMEPWDGPAALAMTDGRWVVGGMDRNGLRPLRYTITTDGLIIGGSETGMVKIDEAQVIEKGRLGPGEMIAVDLLEGKLYHDRELKDHLSSQKPWGQWVKNTTHLDELVKTASEKGEPSELDKAELRKRQMAFGLAMEDMELILHPMAEDGKEAIGSMGDDSPIAVLSDKYRGLHHFFRQNFSQVTNPPINSLRERRVMSLKTRLGNLGNILDEDETQTRLLQLDSPVLTTAEFRAMRAYMGDTLASIDATFPIDGGPDALRDALRRIRLEAEDAVRGGASHVVLTDEAMGPARAAIPAILATAAVHTHLIRSNLRTFTSLNVRSAECLDTHYFAVLIGVGATTVNAYLAQEAVAERHRRGLLGSLPLEKAMANFKKSIDDGLLKIMSKMGISVISSYRGGGNFEAIGLSRALVAEHFPAMVSRISGIGLTGIQKKVLEQHGVAYDNEVVALPVGGFYRFRKSGDRHGWEGGVIHTLQQAVTNDSYTTFKKYSEQVNNRPPMQLRDLLEFRSTKAAVPVDEVESITAIRKRFITPGMSMGALSPEAHGTLNVAMNRIGAKSELGRGRRGSGAFPSRQERRQLELRHQAGGVGPLRRHRRVSEPVPRAGDQGRPGRQARRGRAVARLQGDGDDRQAAPRHPRRDADQPAAAPRHLFHRGSGPAHL